MSWLIWKDYRLNRLIFILAAVLLVLPHVVIVTGNFVHTGTFRLVAPLSVIIWGGSFWSAILSQLIVAVMGGNVIAGERSDRSAEFLGYLPIARRRILASKFLVALGLAAIVWVPNLAVLLPLQEAVGPRFPQAIVLATIATTGLTFFCVAWFFSSMLTSPTFSTCIGLLTPLTVWLCTVWVALTFWVSPETIQHREELPHIALYWYHGVCLSISAVCFVAGSVYFLRRVEP
jgi:ABC-type transport system involved in multi-copper enzyme maturation permease subunit